MTMTQTRLPTYVQLDVQCLYGVRVPLTQIQLCIERNDYERKVESWRAEDVYDTSSVEGHRGGGGVSFKEIFSLISDN